MAATAATLVVLVPIGWMWQQSLVPDTYDVASMGYADHGGGPRLEHDHHEAMAVTDLVADPSRKADVQVTLKVRQEGDRFTVNGSSPGPTIRARQGDLVEVRLVNENITEGTTLHWHGVDVPNAMDGVAGVTQDAVMPGEEFTYRFVANRSGTYWYHSHQVSHEQVRKGLLGALVVDSAATDENHEVVALLHQYGTTSTLNGKEGTQTIPAAVGDLVRVRVIGTDNGLTPAWVAGAPYQVLAVDGWDLNEPTQLTDTGVKVSAGGRIDLGVVVPEGGVRIDFGGTTALVLGDDPTHGEPTAAPDEFVDLLKYGSPRDAGFDADHPDRRFDYRIGNRLGFLDGKPGRWWTINGHLFPDVPMYMVEEGDVVEFTIENDSGKPHPMHLHGHHVLVLSRNGERASGSPWWVDSLEVASGETYVVAFVADNPGLWMDHCHNLPHAVQGLTTHLMYEGVHSSFRVGGKDDNRPE